MDGDKENVYDFLVVADGANMLRLASRKPRDYNICQSRV